MQEYSVKVTLPDGQVMAVTASESDTLEAVADRFKAYYEEMCIRDRTCGSSGFSESENCETNAGIWDGRARKERIQKCAFFSQQAQCEGSALVCSCLLYTSYGKRISNFSRLM